MKTNATYIPKNSTNADYFHEIEWCLKHRSYLPWWRIFKRWGINNTIKFYLKSIERRIK